MIKNLYIKAGTGGGVSLSTAMLMKTGQTTSYALGDDGEVEAGRDIDFFILNELNPFGDTNRFTDEVGLQDYDEGIVIDWSTFNGVLVLGIYNVVQPSSMWTDSVANAQLLSVGSFVTGWRMINYTELHNLVNMELSAVFSYSPMGIPNGNYLRTSTTYPTDTTAAIMSNDERGTFIPYAKTNPTTYLCVRYFNLSELGL